jgi:hypothetical protein
MVEVRGERSREIKHGERRELAGDGPGELVGGNERLERKRKWSRSHERASEIEPGEVQGRHVAERGVARGKCRLGVIDYQLGLLGSTIAPQGWNFK